MIYSYLCKSSKEKWSLKILEEEEGAREFGFVERNGRGGAYDICSFR